MNDPAALQIRRPDLHHPGPAGFGNGDVGHRPVPDVLVPRRHRVLGRFDDEIGRPVPVANTRPFVVGDERFRRRQILRIALQRTAVDPGDDRRHLLVVSACRSRTAPTLQSVCHGGGPTRCRAARMMETAPGARLLVGEGATSARRVRLWRSWRHAWKMGATSGGVTGWAVSAPCPALQPLERRQCHETCKHERLLRSRILPRKTAILAKNDSKHRPRAGRRAANLTSSARWLDTIRRETDEPGAESEGGSR
jgi:hypothetical protein